MAKLRGIRIKVGYPDTWKSYDGLEFTVDDLFGNVERARAFAWSEDLARMSSTLDPAAWELPPQTINAYYNPPRNEIVFPAAILQPPFFDIAADPAVNYGAIGALIGHEITHAFDDQGRKVDAEGRLRNWWTGADNEQFVARAERLAAQYSALSPLPGASVNGQLTLGENIADLGGVLLAFDAWRRSDSASAVSVIDGFTGEQRFFLGWAQIWREKSREDALRQQLSTDPHAPARYRVASTLRNVDAWYSAFGVEPTDAAWLPSDERVRIW